jgi:hypothetical protein
MRPCTPEWKCCEPFTKANLTQNPLSVMTMVNRQHDNPSDGRFFILWRMILRLIMILILSSPISGTGLKTESDELKKAIGSRIIKSGDTRLLAVFKTNRGGRKRILLMKKI